MCCWTLRFRKYQKLVPSTDVEKGHDDLMDDSFKISSTDVNHEKDGHSEAYDPWRSLTPPPLPPFPRVVHSLRKVVQPPDVQNQDGNTDSGSSDPWRSLTPPPLPPFPKEWQTGMTGTVLPPDAQSEETGSYSPNWDPWRSLTPPPLPPFPFAQEKHSPWENTELETINAEVK